LDQAGDEFGRELQARLPGKGNIGKGHLGQGRANHPKVEADASQLHQDKCRPNEQGGQLLALPHTAQECRQVEPLVSGHFALQPPADTIQSPHQQPADEDVNHGRFHRDPPYPPVT